MSLPYVVQEIYGCLLLGDDFFYENILAAKSLEKVHVEETSGAIKAINVRFSPNSPVSRF